MANSPFQIQKVEIPLPVNKGGTGVTTLTDKGVLIGNGTGNVTTIDPGTSGNCLVSNGTDWTSTALSGVGDGTVSYSKLATDLISISAISASDVDWSAGAIFTKTLSNNTTLTFSNPQLDKIIVLEISGNYTLALPSNVSILGGTYNGMVTNYITIHCTRSTSPEEYWATINQRVLSDYAYGYLGGGATVISVYVATTDRIIFSTGVIAANTVSNLSLARWVLSGLSDISSYGYFAGGFTTTFTSVTDRIVFSTGVTSVNTVSNVSQVKADMGALSDGSNYGYFAGGNTGVPITTTDRIIFSTGVTSVNTVSNLSQARQYVSASSDGSNYGYFAGGQTGGGVSVITAERITFSTGATSANTASNLSQSRTELTGISDSTSYGYFAGGNNTTTSYVNTTDRIIFSTGVTSANTASNLSQARMGLSGVSDGISHGYFIGGCTGSQITVATTDRIIFSTSVTSANTVSNLPQSKYRLAGLSDCSV